MKEDLKLTLDNDEQIVLFRLVKKKLEACQWILRHKKASEIRDVEDLEDKTAIYAGFIDKLNPDEEEE